MAIKKLHESKLEDELMIRIFTRECKLMSKIHHHNVVGFIGAVIQPEIQQMAMVIEYCEHGTLYSFLHSNSPMNWKMRFEFGTDIARGMLYIHQRAGIIQRDLKTGTIASL